MRGYINALLLEIIQLFAADKIFISLLYLSIRIYSCVIYNETRPPFLKDNIFLALNIIFNKMCII